MMTNGADRVVKAVQQAPARERSGPMGRTSAETGSPPPLRGGAARVPAYRLPADRQRGTGRDAATRVGPQPVAEASPSGAMQASGGGSPGGDAEASCNGSADGTRIHPNASEERYRTASLLRFTEQRVGHRAVLTAVGEVDISTATDLHRALETADDACVSEIWVDLTHTTFMDCHGLRVLLDLRARCCEARRRLVLICPPGPVLRLLALTGAHRGFEIHPTRTAAHHAH